MEVIIQALINERIHDFMIDYTKEEHSLDLTLWKNGKEKRYSKQYSLLLKAVEHSFMLSENIHAFICKSLKEFIEETANV